MGWNLTYEQAIYARDDLTSTETLVALVMLSHRNAKTGLCYPSQATIARKAKLGRRTVLRAIRGLRDKGVLTGDGDSGKSCQYTFILEIPARIRRSRGGRLGRLPKLDKVGPCGEHLPEENEKMKRGRACKDFS